MLIAALTTAIYFLIGERYTHELGSTRFAAIGMSASALMLALHFAVFRSFDELRPLQAYDWMLLVILGVVCVFIPGLLQAEGMRRVGAQRAAIGSTIGPPTTIFLAALFLGERLNALAAARQRDDRRQRAGVELAEARGGGRALTRDGARTLTRSRHIFRSAQCMAAWRASLTSQSCHHEVLDMTPAKSKSWFTRFAKATAHATGRPATFALAPRSSWYGRSAVHSFTGATPGSS